MNDERMIELQMWEGERIKFPWTGIRIKLPLSVETLEIVIQFLETTKEHLSEKKVK